MLKLETYNLAEAFGWTLIHSLWQGALIAVLLVLVYNLAKPRVSEARYALAVGALLAILLSSGATFYICLEQSKRLHIELNASGESWALEFDNFELFLSEQVGTDAARKAPWNAVLDFVTPYTPWLTWVWLMGFIVFSLRWLMGYVYVQNLRFRHSRPLDFEWQSKLNKLARKMGLNQTLLMLESARIKSPMTLGHLKPVVLVPAGLLTGLSTSQVEAVLAHELAHILRNDFLVNLILSFLEGIFFYHPAVWWISERIRQEREHCCDDMAVNITEDKKEYAETLALVATHSIHSPKMAMTMQGNKQHLMIRIKRLFQPDSYTNRLSGRATFGLIVLMGFSTLAWVSPETAEKMQPKNWAETYETPLLFADWISPSGENNYEAEVESSPSRVAEKIISELENRVYHITRLDSPPPFPPIPPFPDFRGAKLPPRLAMPPRPEFPRSMVIHIDEDMSEEEVEELVEAYEDQIEEWEDEYEEAMEEYAELMEEWGEEFGEKMEETYGRDMEKWGKDYGEKYGKMWERWGEQVAKEIERGAHTDNKEQWMKDLERELSKLGDDFEFRFENDEELHERELEEKLERIREREEEARRVEEDRRILQERERAFREREEERTLERQGAILERQRLEEERAREARERAYRNYEDRMRGYELGRLDRERSQLARDRAMLEREIRSLKGSVSRDNDIIFDDEFLARIDRAKKLAEEIEGQITREEMMRTLDAARKADEERAIREQIIAEQKKQEAIRARYEAEMAAIKRELARAERAKIEMEREMRSRELDRVRIEAEKARIARERARVAEEKARVERELAPVSTHDNVDQKVTKIAEIAKVMKGELVQGGYVRPESHVKLSITNGVIMVNSRPLRSDDYPKYRKLIRMMGVNLYDGDTVIEF